MLGLVKLAALVSAFAASAIAQGTSNIEQGCVTNYDANVDYFPVKADATRFESGSSIKITYPARNYKIVNNTLTGEVIVLYQCGTPLPPASVLATANVTLPVPARSVSISDTTSLTYLDLLGKINNVQYTTGGAQFIVDSCIQSFNGIKDTNATETVAQAQINSTDVFFQFFSTLNTNNSVTFPATTDKTNLNRVDWISFIGAFFNLEAKANSLVAQIKDNYACVSKAAIAAAPAPRKTVAILEYNSPSQFNNNTASWVINNQNYLLNLIQDAGASAFVPTGVTPTQRSTGTQYIFTSTADLAKALTGADFAIDLTYDADSIEETYKNYGFTASSDIAFIKNKQIYSPNKIVNSVGGSAFYEEAVPLQNIVLSDIASIIRPDLLSSYTRRYFRNLEGEAVSLSASSNCANVNVLATGTPVRTATCPAALATTTAAVNTATATTTPKSNAAGLKVGGVVAAIVAVAAVVVA
ncbi:hypothetical protein BC829DRAFT_420841 [Chytridium lagenaria]|nr:hypothetical protein BC829DRAFT_420841 [Chytridium lagenaria]